MQTARARRTDPPTSVEAAASVTPTKVQQVRYALLWLHQRYGVLTGEDAVKYYRAHRWEQGWPEAGDSTIRTRRQELQAAGVEGLSRLPQAVSLGEGRGRAYVTSINPTGAALLKLGPAAC